VPPEVAGPEAKVAALRAIELDANSAEAHEILADVAYLIDWNWDGARKSFQRALELSPNIATAQALYAHFLLIMGKDEEALAHSKRSVELDPFNSVLFGWYSFVLYAQRRYDEALAAGKRCLNLQPDSTLGWNGLYTVLPEMGGRRKKPARPQSSLPKAILEFRGPRRPSTKDMLGEATQRL